MIAISASEFFRPLNFFHPNASGFITHPVLHFLTRVSPAISPHAYSLVHVPKVLKRKLICPDRKGVRMRKPHGAPLRYRPPSYRDALLGSRTAVSRPSIVLPGGLDRSLCTRHLCCPDLLAAASCSRGTPSYHNGCCQICLCAGRQSKCHLAQR